MSKLTLKDKAEIEKVGYVVSESGQHDSSFKEGYIFKVKEGSYNSGSCDNDSYLMVLVELDCIGSTTNGLNSKYFRLATKKEGVLYEMCGKPVHVSQLDTFKNMSKKDKLITEAQVRGFVKGAKVICMIDGRTKEITQRNYTTRGVDYTYYPSTDSLYASLTDFSSVIIYSKGKWAKFAGVYATERVTLCGYDVAEGKDGEIVVGLGYADDYKYWYKRVKVDDWIKCVDPRKESGDVGLGWERNEIFKVLHITKDKFDDGSDRYIFMINVHGSGVIHTACTPVIKDELRYADDYSSSFTDRSKRPVVPFDIEYFDHSMGMLPSAKMELHSVDGILPINRIKRKRKVKTEILETNIVTELLIKKRRKRK